MRTTAGAGYCLKISPHKMYKPAPAIIDIAAFRKNLQKLITPRNITRAFSFNRAQSKCFLKNLPRLMQKQEIKEFWFHHHID